MEHSEFRQELLKMDVRFNQTIAEVRDGFKRMDERFGAIQQQMDRRFEASDKRFEVLERHFDKRFTMMFSFITVGFVAMATMMSVFQFLQ